MRFPHAGLWIVGRVVYYGVSNYASRHFLVNVSTCVELPPREAVVMKTKIQPGPSKIYILRIFESGASRQGTAYSCVVHVGGALDDRYCVSSVWVCVLRKVRFSVLDYSCLLQWATPGGYIEHAVQH